MFQRVLGLAAVAALAGVAPFPVAAQPAGQVVVAHSADVGSLDPTWEVSIPALRVFGNIFSALTQIEADGSVKPDLATSWSASGDAKSWTFKMNPAARFHDGKPVTADDVVWMVGKIKADEKAPRRTYTTVIQSVEKVDGDSVRFTLASPFAAFHGHASLLQLVPKEGYERMGAGEFSKQPIGSGPFKVNRWVKDDRIELEAVPNHWSGEAKIKTLVFRPIASEAARSAALQSGDVDLVVGLPPTAIEAIRSRPGLKVETVASNQVVYLGVNVTNPLLSDVRMRQAIDLAIDRNAISNQLLRGLGRPIGQILAPTTFGYDSSIAPSARNVEKARQLLKDAGYKGQTIVFQYPNNRLTLGNEVTQAIANYLREVGIAVELQGMDNAALTSIWQEKRASGIFLHSFGPSLLDAELPLTMLYESKNFRGYWVEPKVDELIVRQRATTDQNARKETIAAIWKVEREGMPYIPVYNVLAAFAMKQTLDWTPRPDDQLLFHKAALRR